MRKTPFFTATAVLSLAVGIGANVAIFRLIDAVLLRESPIVEPERLADVYLSTPDFEFSTLSYPDFRDLRRGTQGAFSSIAASRLVLARIERGEEIEAQLGEAVTGSYFRMLGLEAHVGRTFEPEDDRSPGGHAVAMLGYDYWQSAFGGDPGVVGRPIRLAGRPYTIVGVAPESYAGSLRGIAPAVYVPMMMVNQVQASGIDELEARDMRSLFVKARLADGVTLAEARGAADAVAKDLASRRIQGWDLDARFRLIPSAQVVVFPPLDRVIRAAAWLLFGIAGLVVLLACVNLAGFLLARVVDQRREIALRRALGAGRPGLVGQALVETVLLGLLGGAGGLALGSGLLRLLQGADLPLPIPVSLDLRLDLTVLAYTLVISVAAGLALGLAPALLGARTDLATTLKDDSAGGGQRGRTRMRSALVVAQVAASALLLVAAGLFLRSLHRLRSVDPGFGRAPTAIVSLAVPADLYDPATEGPRLARTLVERVAALPGVETAGLIDNLHLNPLSVQTSDLRADGVEPPPGREWHTADRAVVDEGFFATAGIPLLSGRGFDEHIDRPEAPQVAVVNETLARRFWPGETALGKRLRSGDEVWEVIGVTADVKVRSLGEAPRLFVYRPLSQRYSPFLTVVARTSIDAERAALDVLRAVRELDPGLTVWETKTMERHLGVMLLPARLSALLVTAFAGLALALASIGLYGLVSYAVAQRTREVGIRMSLGADATGVVHMLLGDGLRLAGLGAAIGLLLAALVARLLGGFLYQESAFDLTAFAIVALVLVGAAGLATWLPARRAARVSPVEALRTE